MSQTLTIELHERVFTAIQQQAITLGIPAEQLAATLLEQTVPSASESLSPLTEQLPTSTNFEAHFGTLTLDTATDLANESIDQDLANEYLNSHEEA